jgi:hypothetical protein
MKQLGIFVAVAFAAVTTSNGALAQTKAEKCAAYARQMTASTPTTTGPVRGAARKSRSYQSYYNECMSR